MENSMKITTQIETITPEMADGYIALSVGNRSIKRTKLASLIRDMKNGKYEVNGEGIIFDDAGSLIDGHHRLTACRESEITIQSIVVRGVSKSSHGTIDTGTSRTVGDTLHMGGVKHANSVAATAVILACLKNGKARSVALTTTEVYQMIEAYPSILDVKDFASRALTRCGSLLGALYVVAEKTGDGVSAAKFRDVLKSGVPAYEGCPAHLFRERLIRESMMGKPCTLGDLHVLFFTAWEKFRRGDKVKTLKASSRFFATGWTA